MVLVAGESLRVGEPRGVVLHAVVDVRAFAPSEADYSRAARIIEAYAHATKVDQRGAVMLGDEMIDEASRKMAEVIVARGNAAGFASGEPGQTPE